MTIIEFLHARLDGDEAYARTAFADHNDAGPEWSEPWSGGVMAGPEVVDTFDSGISRHMVRHDPARVLREIAAKRTILAEHTPTDWPTRAPAICPVCGQWNWEVAMGDDAGTPLHHPCPTLRLLASVYADHPDYQQEWAP